MVHKHGCINDASLWLHRIDLWHARIKSLLNFVHKKMRKSFLLLYFIKVNANHCLLFSICNNDWAKIINSSFKFLFFETELNNFHLFCI